MVMFCTIYIENKEDISKFEEIYTQYAQALVQYALPIVNHHHDLAENAVSEAFIALSKHPEILSTRSSYVIQSYLFTSTKNFALNIIAVENRLEQIQNEYASLYHDLERVPLNMTLHKLCTKESVGILQEEIQNLPQIYRDILYLHYLCGISLRENADQFGSNYSTVRKQHERAKKILIMRLLERGITPYE